MNRRQFLKGLSSLAVVMGLPTIKFGEKVVFVEALPPRTVGALSSQEFVKLLDLRLKNVTDNAYSDMSKLPDSF